MHKPQIAVALRSAGFGPGPGDHHWRRPRGCRRPARLPSARTPGHYRQRLWHAGRSRPVLLSADLKQSNGPCLVITAPRVMLDLAGQNADRPLGRGKRPLSHPAPGLGNNQRNSLLTKGPPSMPGSKAPCLEAQRAVGFDNGIEDSADDAVIAGPAIWWSRTTWPLVFGCETQPGAW